MSKGNSSIRLGQTAEEIQRKPVSSSFNPGGLEKVGQAISEAAYSLGNKWMQKESIKESNRQQAMQKQADMKRELFILDIKGKAAEKSHALENGWTDDDMLNPASAEQQIESYKTSLMEDINNSEYLTDVDRKTLENSINGNVFSLQDTVKDKSLKVIKNHNIAANEEGLYGLQSHILNNAESMTQVQLKEGMAAFGKRLDIQQSLDPDKYDDKWKEDRYKDLAKGIVIGRYRGVLDEIGDSKMSYDEQLQALGQLKKQVKGSAGQDYLQTAFGDKAGYLVLDVRDMLDKEIDSVTREKEAQIKSLKEFDLNKQEKLENNSKKDPVWGYQKDTNVNATMGYDSNYMAYASNKLYRTNFDNSIDAEKWMIENNKTVPVFSTMNGDIDAIKVQTEYTTAGGRTGQIQGLLNVFSETGLLDKSEFIEDMAFKQVQEATGIDRVQFDAYQHGTGNYDFTKIDTKIADVEHGAGVDLNVNISDYTLNSVLGKENVERLGVFGKASRVNIEMGNNYSRAGIMIQKRMTAGFLQNADAKTVENFNNMTPTDRQEAVRRFYDKSSNKEALIKDVDTILGAYTENREAKEINGKAFFINKKYKDIDFKKEVKDYSKQELYYQDSDTGEIKKANSKDIKLEVVARGIDSGNKIQPIFRGSPLLKKKDNGQLEVDIIDLSKPKKEDSKVKDAENKDYSLYGVMEGDSD